MVPSENGGVIPQLDAEDLLRTVPAIKDIARIETFSPTRLPSASLDPGNLIRLAQTTTEFFADGVDGVVIIQGTDTIEESAFLFDLLIQSDKPVVVTGAMRSPAQPGADGPANLLAAIAVAASTKARGLGTLVVLNDEIHAARFVQKSHTALPSAFTSPYAGPIGYIVEGSVQILLRPTRAKTISMEPSLTFAPVALLKMAMGDDGRNFGVLSELKYAGAIIEGMGAGHVAEAAVPIIEQTASLMPVALASRVHTGPSFTRTYGYAGSEIDLLGRGVLSAGWLSGLKARILLSLLLGSASAENVATSFKQHVLSYSI